MALGSTQPLKEMSTRSISWGKGGQCIRLTTYHHPVPLSRNLGTLISWNPLGLPGPVTGLLYCMQLQYINILSTTSRYICPKNMPLCKASKAALSGSPPSSFLDSALSTTLFPFFPVPLPFGTALSRILSFVLLTSSYHILVCYEPHIYPRFLYICNIFPC